MYFMKRVFGRYGAESMAYLTRFKLCPMTRWGQLYIHFFHRGDCDRAFHDHPYDFWTFPLRTYYERVLNLETGRDTLNAVTAWSWHFRPAEYTHIQMGSVTKGRRKRFQAVLNLLETDGPTVTFVWRKHTRRMWGFWKHELTYGNGLKIYNWVYHKDYENAE